MNYQYQLLPSLSPEEYADLKADIAERGVQVPVEFDESGNILDGHHRMQICAELGIKNYPSIVRSGFTEEQKTEHVLSLNLNRRHLSKEQRAELVATLRALGWSNRRIAGRLNVSDITVRRDLSGATFDAPDHVTGADGKQYPATMTRREDNQLPFSEVETDEDDPEATYEFDYQQADAANAAGFAVAYPDPPRPHVSHNSGNNEWYTPYEYIEAAHEVLDFIDLDPASSNVANETVGATTFYTAEDDGLVYPWFGRVWMNPPYAAGLIDKFCEKLAAHYEIGEVTEAIVLVNNATETGWFNTLIGKSAAVVFPKSRIRFIDPEGKPSGTPLQGQAVIYMGEQSERFLKEFSRFGWGAVCSGQR